MQLDRTAGRKTGRSQGTEEAEFQVTSPLPLTTNVCDYVPVVRAETDLWRVGVCVCVLRLSNGERG